MRKDIASQRFGRLTALKVSYVDRNGDARWLCQCDCGNQKVVVLTVLTRGRSKSCGCLHRERLAPRHGHSTRKGWSPTYRSWVAMKQRCLNPASSNFGRYGGCGVTLCKRWHSFENLLADMGERPPGMTLDRIDNRKGYEPGNCRWATDEEQRRNKRSNGPRPKLVIANASDTVMNAHPINACTSKAG